MTRTNVKRLLAVVILGFLVMAATAWRLYPSTPKVDPSSVEFLYCEKCQKEFAFNQQKDDLKDPCPLCYGKRLPLKQSIKRTGPINNPYTKMFTFIAVEGMLVMAAVWFVARPQSESEEDYIYMLCPHCNQKLRYVEKQIGKPGACRRCKRAFVFPELEVSRR